MDHVGRYPEYVVFYEWIKMFEDKNIILASGSPRRKYLLEQAEIEFVINKASVDEAYPTGMEPMEIPAFLAEKKALAVKPNCSKGALILAADTLVILGNKVMGKPVDKTDAFRILTALSGRMHVVITGVCLLLEKKKKIFSVGTKVYFRQLSPAQIEHYIDAYHPMDKAGAYAIQEWIGLTGIEKIEGDYFNVVGLPVGRVIEEISKF